MSACFFTIKDVNGDVEPAVIISLGGISITVFVICPLFLSPFFLRRLSQR